MGVNHLLWSIFVTILVTSQCEEIPVRLKGGNYFEGGLVEVWKDGAWGALCDRGRKGWNIEAGHLVCQQLGFSRALKAVHGTSPIASVIDVTRIATNSVECYTGDYRLDRCHIQWGGVCPVEDSVSVVCDPESRSSCGLGATAFLGSCYKIITDQATFVDAQRQCGRMKDTSNLVEITSALENSLVTRLIEKSMNSTFTSFWTGGVVHQVLDTKMKFWHGSQKQIQFDNDLDESGAKDIPQGIVVKRDIKEVSTPWSTDNFESRHSFICEFQPDDIGCLSDDDESGEKYQGVAASDKDGNSCLPWDTTQSGQKWRHNYCRNPDGDEKPYCFIEKETPSYCNIPACSAIPRSSSTPSPCSPSGTETSQCFKEEYTCQGGSCISNEFICDGEIDCPDGDDERGCRRIAGLYAKEEGFKLEGLVGPVEDESVPASEEECAKLCHYSKKCCQSFSTRPGKDGKKDLCLLSTVFDNQGFDTLVQKSSWNYYILNTTDPRLGRAAKCRSKKGTGNPTPIEGLRLRNRARRETGKIVEVKVEGVWGGICDDTFQMNEANVVCKQMGFPLGAKEVIKRANGNRKAEQVVLAGLHCNGNERRITDCTAQNKEAFRCSVDQMVGVVCQEVEEGSCDEDHFHCKSGECIEIEHLCDGIPNNCQDNSDEDIRMCSLRIQVRLTDKEHYGDNSGLLEVRHKGVWGTVCTDNFEMGEATVFCRMLGYDGEATIGEVDTVRQRTGSWPIWIALRGDRRNKCQGTEVSIEECHEPGLWEHDYVCDHREDVVLTCKDNSIKERSLQSDSLTQRSSPPPQQIVEQCGLWRKAPTSQSDDGTDVPRIAGGVKVPHGTLPWQASIRLRGPGDRTFHHCGAVILSPFHILTTAHCLWDYKDTVGLYLVRVGDNVIEITDDEEQEFDIHKIDFHEDFGVGPYLNNDIAVIHIVRQGNTGIKFGDKVSPVCLPPKDLALTPALNLTVSGWGKNGYDQAGRQPGTNFVSKLNMAVVPVIPRNICREPQVYGPEKISLGMFCAGNLEGGQDTCQGDSGGPAVGYIHSDQYHEVRATLVGITSWGYGCGRANKPGVYTQISKYVDWIYEKTRGDL